MKDGDLAMVLSLMKSTPKAFVQETIASLPDDDARWAAMSMVLLSSDPSAVRSKRLFYLVGYLVAGAMISVGTSLVLFFT